MRISSNCRIMGTKVCYLYSNCMSSVWVISYERRMWLHVTITHYVWPVIRGPVCKKNRLRRVHWNLFVFTVRFTQLIRFYVITSLLYYWFTTSVLFMYRYTIAWAWCTLLSSVCLYIHVYLLHLFKSVEMFFGQIFVHHDLNYYVPNELSQWTRI